MLDNAHLRVTGALAALALFGCSAPAAAPPSAAPSPSASAQAAAGSTSAAASQEIPREPVETGQACAKAVAQCGGGVCEVSIDSTCDKPMTCSLGILTVCQAETDLVQVKSRGKDTVAAQSKGKLSLAANCVTGRVVSTKVRELECK